MTLKKFIEERKAYTRNGALKLTALQTAIRTGLEALEHGNYTELADLNLAVALDRLAAPRKKRCVT